MTANLAGSEGLFEPLLDFEAYLTREEGLSPLTARQYALDCLKLSQWLERERPRASTWTAVEDRDLRAYMTAHLPAPARSRRLLASWRKLWQYLSKVEKLEMKDGPTELKRAKLPGRQPKYLTPDEVARLVLHVPGSTPEQSHRNRALIAFLYGTGCRISEVLSLTLDAIEYKGQTPVRIRVIGKGDKERSIYLSPTAQRALQDWLWILKQQGDPKSPLVFSHLSGQRRGKAVTARSVELLVKAAGQQAGLPAEKCTPHKLRHSHATALMKAGRRLEEVQEILGHESIATTRIYAHLEPERLEAAAASLPDVL